MLSITSTAFAIQNEPKGLRELEHRVYYSNELRGYIEEFNGDLTFYGGDYRYLRNEYISGSCSIIPVRVADSCGQVYDGNLFLNDADWRPDICEVTLQMVDGGFLSLIAQNMEIKAYVNVPRSKNDVDISAYVTVQTDLLFREHEIGVDTSTPADRHGVRVYDAFKMLIGFMTDGLLGFQSAFLFPDDDTIPLRPRIPTLLTGREIREGGGVSFPYISFQELWSDMSTLYNLSFDVRGGVFIIEQRSFFRQTGQPLTISYPDAVRQATDRGTLYQKIKFGSPENPDQYLFYPDIQFRSWNREEYHMGGNCNSEAILDLQLKTLIIDTNIIQGCLPYGVGNPQNVLDPPYDSYDKSVLYVVFDINNQTVVSASPLDPDFQFYNGRVLNNEVALRWGDGVPYPIFLFLGSNQNGARGYVDAGYTPDLILAPYVNFPPIGLVFGFTGYLRFPIETPFPEGYDPNGNLAVVSTTFNFFGVAITGDKSVYTAPVSGIYTVSVRLVTNDDWYAGAETTFGFVKMPSSGVDEVDYFMIDVQNGFAGNYYMEGGAMIMEGSFTFYLDAGERILVIYQNASGLGSNPLILTGSWMQVDDTLTITQTYSEEANYMIGTTFDYPIPSDQWQSFLNDRHGEISVVHQNGTIRGYLHDVTRQLENTMTNWTIRSTFGDS